MDDVLTVPTARASVSVNQGSKEQTVPLCYHARTPIAMVMGSVLRTMPQARPVNARMAGVSMRLMVNPI